MTDEQPRTENMGFGLALEHLNRGAGVSRVDWNGTAVVYLQTPDANSKMTEPYLYVVRDRDESIFPFSIGQDSLLANDWYVVNEGRDILDEIPF